MNYYPMYRDGSGHGYGHRRHFPVLPFLAGLAVSPFLFGWYGGGPYGGPYYGPQYGPSYGPQYGPGYGPQFGPYYGPQFGPTPYSGGYY